MTVKLIGTINPPHILTYLPHLSPRCHLGYHCRHLLILNFRQSQFDPVAPNYVEDTLILAEKLQYYNMHICPQGLSIPY